VYNSNELKESGLTIVARLGEDIESMIKRFKRKVNKSGILRDAKKKEYYDKPSLAKKKKSIEARRVLEKEKRKEEARKHKKGERNERNSSDK
jgi:small subunit ribosomal protein S21